VPETAPSLVGGGNDPTKEHRPRARLIHPAGIFPGIVILLALSGMAYYLTFVPLYVRTIGVDGAGAALAEYGLIVVALRAVGARLPDRLGATLLSGSALAASAVGLATLGALQTPLGLYLGTGLFAAGIAFVMPALISLAVSLAPAEERGTVVGTATLFIDVSFGIAPVVLGGVAEVGGYPLGFVVAAASTTPEVVEYPDAGKVAAMAKTPSQQGPGLWTMHFLESGVGCEAERCEGFDVRAPDAYRSAAMLLVNVTNWKPAGSFAGPRGR